MSNRLPEHPEDARRQLNGLPEGEPTARAVPGAARITDIAEGVAEAEASLVAEDVAQEVAETTTRRRLRPLETLMLVMLAVSLLIHALTISRLLSVRQTLRDEVERLAGTVQDAKSASIRYDLPVNQQIPINIDVPIQRSLNIPINTEVRIKQDVVLPVDTGFGSLDIPIPIDATIPVSTTVPIEFDQTINISTTVPLQLNVPVQIDLGSQQISGYLDRLHDALLELRDRF